jgi:lysozyme
VDVSNWQGPPGDWHDAAGSISWAAVKLTELEPGGSRYVNQDAAADWAYLKARGLGRIAYLFGHPSMSASASVALFITELSAQLGLEDGDGVCLDLETTDGCTAAQTASWSHDVLAMLRSRLGRAPLLYTFLSFADEGNCAGLGGYPLWIADPSSPAGHPRVPAPWKTWMIHQYVITGPIDRDVARWGTVKAMAASIGRSEPKPEPEPKPVPVSPADVEQWHALGLWSLDKEASEHHTTPQEMLYLAKAAGHEYGPAMTAYIQRHDWSARVPSRTLLFAPKR